MSSFSSDFAVSGGAQMLSYIGDSVTYYANGAGSGTSVTAIVEDLSDGGEESVSSSGVRRVRQKKLQVAVSQSVSQADQWGIDGLRWQTVASTAGHDGLKEVVVQRTDESKIVRAQSHG